MPTIKPTKLGSKRTNAKEKLTAAEMGKLWATYVGNSMSECILSYFLKHVEDKEIKTLVGNGLNITKDFKKKIEDLFNKDNFPIPIGFLVEGDVNLEAPRLFEDEFYVHYLKYAVKAGLSLYNMALPIIFREDVKDFFYFSLHTSLTLLEQIKDLLIKKDFIIKPPEIPVPDKVEFVDQNFLHGYLGHVRPLHALEIAHLYDNIENNATSKALILGFRQVVHDDKIRKIFKKGEEISHKAVEQSMQQLQDANLPAPSFIDHFVTTSTVSPFSDKLMLYHKVDMFSMKIRSIGNSFSVNGRHDIGFMYMKSFTNIALFIEEAAKTMIEKGWMEKPPEAIDRDALASSSRIEK